MPTLARFIALLIALLSGVAKSDIDAARNIEPAARPWRSSTHLGFAMLDSSTQHRGPASGSVLFLDLKYQTDETLTLGLRTLGLGGRTPMGHYYRLASGPMIQFAASANWTLDLTAAWFRESGVADRSSLDYRSSGWAYVAGWRRLIHQGSRVELSWGGFIGIHRGDSSGNLTAAGTIATNSADTPSPAKTNNGVWHGLEMALDFSL